MQSGQKTDKPQSRAILSIREHGEEAKILAPGHLISALRSTPLCLGLFHVRMMAKACRCLHYDLFLITSGALKKDAAVIKKKTALESPQPEHRAHRNVPESSIFQVWSVRRVLVSRVHTWKLTTSAYAAMCFGERRYCAILFKDEFPFPRSHKRH